MCKVNSKILIGLAIFMLSANFAALATEEQPVGFDCVITPSQTVDLGSQESGQISEVLVDRGDRVSANQIVASLDSRLEAASVAVARDRAAMVTELSMRKALFAIDRQTEKRVSSLVESKAASLHDRDQASRELKLSAWRLIQAEDDIQLNELELSRTETALDLRRIRSPIDGVVLARMLDPGEHLDSEPLLRIVNLDPLHVEAILPMRLFGKVKPGMSARVLSEIDEATALVATVEVVDPMGDAGSGTFGVRLSLPNPQETIPAGVKCRVELDAEQVASND